MKLDHQLFDVVQTSRTGKYGIERTPFRTLDVYLQDVNRSLRNSIVPLYMHGYKQNCSLYTLLTATDQKVKKKHS